MEPGLAFSVEPGVYRAGELGIRVEDTIVVGREGPERTTHGPHELLIV
jgi:Xaa-Pro aminopeptidase